jgi:hypothetical protein
MPHSFVQCTGLQIPNTTQQWRVKPFLIFFLSSQLPFSSPHKSIHEIPTNLLRFYSFLLSVNRHNHLNSELVFELKVYAETNSTDFENENVRDCWTSSDEKRVLTEVKGVCWYDAHTIQKYRPQLPATDVLTAGFKYSWFSIRTKLCRMQHMVRRTHGCYCEYTTPNDMAIRNPINFLERETGDLRNFALPGVRNRRQKYNTFTVRHVPSLTA